MVVDGADNPVDELATPEQRLESGLALEDVHGVLGLALAQAAQVAPAKRTLERRRRLERWQPP